MTTRIRSVAGVLGVLGTLIGALVGQPDAAGAATGAGTFTATWSGSVAVTGPTTFTFAGTGTSDPMGPITAHGAATITGLGLSCLGALLNTNVETLQAADGSLTITSHDVGCITGVGTFHGTGTWTVTGGTGRYRDAVGSGSLDGRVNILAGTSILVANGYLVL
jgi:hypothetical protein